MADVANSENLTKNAVRILGIKIDNLCKPTNADKLSMVFEELGIALGDLENQVISNRNRSLHGKKMLKNGSDTQQCDEETQRYDILRTLIGRALLHMLGYEGPYVDYGARPETGNFPIQFSAPPRKMSQAHA